MWLISFLEVFSTVLIQVMTLRSSDSTFANVVFVLGTVLHLTITYCVHVNNEIITRCSPGKVRDVHSSRTHKAQSRISTMTESRVEHFIYKEGEERPWYFSSTSIYEAVKNAASAIPVSPIFFDRAVDTLTIITSFISDKTQAKIVIVNRENVGELLTKLNGIVVDHLIVLDGT